MTGLWNRFVTWVGSLYIGEREPAPRKMTLIEVNAFPRKLPMPDITGEVYAAARSCQPGDEWCIEYPCAVHMASRRVHE